MQQEIFDGKWMRLKGRKKQSKTIQWSRNWKKSEIGINQKHLIGFCSDENEPEGIRTVGNYGALF